jgi:repressor LexA
MSYLTERQAEVLDLIRQRLTTSGIPPTLREIAEELGFASTATAQKHVNLLVAKGYLERVKHQKRGLVVVAPDAAARSEVAAVVTLPVLGTIAAGSPIESLEGHGEVAVPRTMVGPGDHYVLAVRGDSMIEDGINDGDQVVVRRASSARRGDAVVALVDGEVTLKRFHPDGARVRLEPANQALAPIVVDAARVAVQGVVVALLRRY